MSYSLILIYFVYYCDAFFIIPGGAYHSRMIFHKLKKNHIETIQNKSSIDIFTSEMRNIYPYNTHTMCPMLHSYTEYPIYTDEFIELFKNKWKTNVYTKENYPLTYDNQKPINITSNILIEYRQIVCLHKEYISNIIFWFAIIPILFFTFIGILNVV